MRAGRRGVATEVADLDCSGRAGDAVTLNGRLLLNGVTLTGNPAVDVVRCGVISAAAPQLSMPCKRAWLPIATLSQGPGRSVVETATGGGAAAGRG